MLVLQNHRKNSASFGQLLPINCWFDNWEKILVRFGFGKIQDNRKVGDQYEQKSCILNLDERALSLDGSTQQHGGHPTMSFYYGVLPLVVLSVVKIHSH